jgi:hypothetical protein
MDIERMFGIIGSFVVGFGKRSSIDVNNAVFIAEKMKELDLQLDFEEAGRLGVESTRLYGILRKARPEKKYQKASNIGKKLSNFDSRELMLMALYLWNEGENSLSEEEKEEALSLLEKKFNILLKGEGTTKLPPALASG